MVNPDGTLVDRLSFMLVESLAPAAKATLANTAHLSQLDRVTTATDWDLAATTAVEDDTSEARAQRLSIVYQEVVKGLLLTTATAWDLGR